MKTIRTKAAEALSETEKAVFSEISPKIGRRFHRSVLIWFGITLCAAVILSAAAYIRFDLSPLFTFAFTFFIGILVLWTIVSATERSWSKDLPPAPLPDSAQLFADKACREELNKLKKERGTLLFAGFILLGLSPLFLLIAVLRAHYAQKRPGTAHCAAEYYAANLARVINTAALVTLPFVLTCMILPWHFQFSSFSRVSAMNMAARGILNAAEKYQADMDAEDRWPAWKTTIVSPGETGGPGTLPYGIALYYPELDSEHLWYAVVVSETGVITEAYCSHSPLTEADLVPTNDKQQRELASSLLHSREIIGYGSWPSRK